MWFSSLDDNVRDRITKHFGEFPLKDENTQVRKVGLIARLQTYRARSCRTLKKNFLNYE